MPDKSKSNKNYQTKAKLSCTVPGCEEVRCATKASLRRHQKDQHPDDPAALVCPKCSLGGFTGTRQVQRHLKEKHFAAKAVCIPCQQFFPRRTSLKRHQRSVHPSDPSELDCFICGTHHASIEARQKHEKASKHKSNISQGVVEQTVFPCRSCAAPFASPTLCHKHFQAVHRHKRVWHCPHCNDSFTSKAAQLGHERNFHAPLAERTCGSCKLELKSRSKRTVHEQTCRRLPVPPFRRSEPPSDAKVERLHKRGKKLQKEKKEKHREASPRRAKPPHFQLAVEPAVHFDEADRLYNSQMFHRELGHKQKVFSQYHSMMRVALADAAALAFHTDGFCCSPEPAEEFQRVLFEKIKVHLLADKESSGLPEAISSLNKLHDFSWLAQVVCFAYRTLTYETDVNPGSDLIRLTFSNPVLSELAGTSPQVVCDPAACRTVLILRLAFWPYQNLLRIAQHLAEGWRELFPDEHAHRFVQSLHDHGRTSLRFVDWVNALRLIGCAEAVLSD
jgi:hypothetical protein